MITLLTEPLAYAFMQRGLLAAVLVGIVCALVGTFVVLRGMAFLGDALPHAILPGVAAGYLLGGGARGPVLWGSLIAAIFTALGIGALTRGARIREDSAIGIFFAGMFALGIALISSIRSYAVDLTHFLFGNVLGVTSNDLWLIGALGALVTLTLIAFYKEFMVLSFDARLAATLRLPTNLLENLLLVLIALTIVIALQTVGIALMVAMLVTPAATASLLTNRLHKMMMLAAAIAAFSGVAGLYLSYYASIASGAAIVLVCTACFLLAWAWQSARARMQHAGK
ncbi:MAG: metal ABC transporter permease [Anaerolineae bacterium]|nr:MAG: metal ABC transporter permease [Anaerolineae bacterium]